MTATSPGRRPPSTEATRSCTTCGARAPRGKVVTMTKALCIVFEKIHDQEGFDAYRSQVLPTLEPFGGEFVVRGGAFTALEGDMQYERVVVLQFPSREAAEGWYHSDAYQAIIPLRLNATECLFLVVDAME